MAEIKGTPTGEIDDKRVYLPGVTLTDTCPGCGKTVTISFESHYIAFPEMNQPFRFVMWHGDCDGPDGETEWPVTLKLNVSLEVVDGDAG